MSQSSPVPDHMAVLSYQSMSTPSKLLFNTNDAKLLATAIGSFPCVVGYSVDPNAETNTFLPASLKAFLNLLCTVCVLLLIQEKYTPALAHARAISAGPDVSQNDKAKIL